MERIELILKKVLRKLKIDKRIAEEIVLKEWSNLVGKEIATHTHPVGIKGGVLFINVDDSVWVNELNFLKWKIIEVINKKMERRLVKNIYLKTG